ncbi:MAG: RNA polymerase sigma factor [Anaeroplasma sp.]
MDKRRLNYLLIQIGNGNEKAFEEFYYSTVKGIYAFIYPYFNNTFDTEDALQDIYIIVKDKAYMYKKDTDARAWLFQVAKNHCLNLVNKHNKELNCLADINVSLSQNNTKWDTTIFLIMQHTLNEDEYQIVIRYVLMGYKHKEIANELHIPLGTVLSKYQTALKKLRKELEND